MMGRDMPGKGQHAMPHALEVSSLLLPSRPQNLSRDAAPALGTMQSWGHVSLPNTRPRRTGARLTFSTWRRTCGQRRSPCALPRHCRTAAPSSTAGSHRPAVQGHSGQSAPPGHPAAATIARARGDAAANLCCRDTGPSSPSALHTGAQCSRQAQDVRSLPRTRDSMRCLS